MRIFVDVDNTVADLLSEWLRLYNKDYDDTLQPDQLVEWDIDKFVKPECGVRIYEYLLSPKLYDHVYPIDGATTGVQTLRRLGHQVVFASAGVYSYSKFLWLEKYGFMPGKNGANFISVYDKSLLRGDMLIDDKPANLEAFSGKIVLFDQPWNQNAMISRAFTWHDVIYLVRNA